MIREQYLMTLLNLPANKLKDAINALVDDRERESRTLDYKSETYGNGDEAKNELRADVVAFANTSGGTVILGIKEDEEGIPKLCGLTIDPDKLANETDRLEKILGSGIVPRLPRVQVDAVTFDDSKVATVIRVS